MLVLPKYVEAYRAPAIKNTFFKILTVSCEFGFLVLKKCLFDLKTLSTQNLAISIKKSSEFGKQKNIIL